MDLLPNLKDVIKELSEKYKINRCANCGNQFEWSERQFKRICQCGSILIRTSAIPREAVKCWICCDTGIATYWAQLDGFNYENGATCICQAGEPYRLNKNITVITDSLFAPPLQTIIRRNQEMCKYKGGDLS
jgi:hypothetical protein